MSAADQYFESGGVPIRFVDEGTGAPVALVHGMVSSVEMWNEAGVLQSLPRQFHVAALDCRGHGQSGKPHDEASYGVEMALDVLRLLDRLGAETAHLVGYSMGAEIALKLAILHPDRVRSLVMGGSGWSGPQESENYRLISESLRDSGSMAGILRAMTPPGGEEPTEDEIRQVDALFESQDTDALIAVTRAMKGIVDVSQKELAELRIPVLGISGEHDPERANLEKMAGIVPDFRMCVLDGRNHMDALSDPDFSRLIHEFLSAQS